MKSSVSLDIPLPSGALTSDTAAPAPTVCATHFPRCSIITSGSVRHGVSIPS